MKHSTSSFSTLDCHDCWFGAEAPWPLCPQPYRKALNSHKAGLRYMVEPPGMNSKDKSIARSAKNTCIGLSGKLNGMRDVVGL